MTEEKELETWRAEWQSLGGRAELARELAERAKTGSAKMKRKIALEIAASVLSNFFCLHETIKSGGAPTMLVLCAGMFCFGGIWLTRLFTLADTKANATSLDSYVDLLGRQLDNDTRWNTFSRGATVALGVALTPWAFWMLAAHWDVYRAEPWRFVIGFGGIVVIVVGVVAMTAKKGARLAAERERFDALVAERMVG